MKKPTLRFRQVFEHPTHFKVTRPLGNPIKIAKQGLSPNLMGRLRRFAEGGETPEPTQQDQANLDELMAGSALPEPTIPQSFRSTVMQDAARIEDQEERAQFIKNRINEYRAAAFADPALLTVQSQPFPEIVRADQIEQTPVSVMGTPVMGPSAPRITQSEPLKPVAVEPVAEAAPKARPQPVQSGAAPAGIVASTVESVATEAPAAAPVSVAPPVAAAAPMAVSPAPAPMATVAKPTPADDYLAARQTAQDSIELARKELADKEIEVQQDRERAAREEYNRRAGALAGAQRAFDEARAEKPTTAADVGRSIGNAISVAMGAFASGMTGMPNFALQIYNAGVEESLKRAREDRNSAYNKMIDAGLSAEEASKAWRIQQDKTLAMGLQDKAMAVSNAEARAKALDTVRMVNAKVAKDEADLNKTMAEAAHLEAQTKDIPAKRAMENLDLQRKAADDLAKNLNEANKIKVTDEASKRDYNAAVFKAKTQYDADLALIAAKQKSSEAEEEEEKQQRELTVGDTELELKSKTGGKGIRENLSARNQAIMSAVSLVDLFKTHGNKVFDLTDNVRSEAIAELNYLIEQYPKAAGFQRALSLSAAKQLKLGLQDPTSFKALALKVLGRDPVVPIEALLREAQRSRDQYIIDQVRNPQSDAVKNAIKSQRERELEMASGASGDRGIPVRRAP
jgi:hypothetical protein